MKKCVNFLILIILSTASTLFAIDTNDRQTIGQIIEHITNAWNYHGGNGFADHYTQDADFVNIFGMAFSGKEEIENRHTKILETFLKGSSFEVVDLKLREAKPEVVIALVYWKVSFIQKPGEDPLKETMKGIFTHVFIKNRDKWEITATQNTSISN